MSNLFEVVLVDPSLFTAPYDGGLDQGLRANQVETVWFVRPLRAGEQSNLSSDRALPAFYRTVDQKRGLTGKFRALAKGYSHVVGLANLVNRVARQRPRVVHFQWAVLPIIDAVAMMLIRQSRPVVMTVHDTIPFNGETKSFLQNFGFDLPLKVADRLIVHTQKAKQNLLARGLKESKIRIVPHGPLRLAHEIDEQGDISRKREVSAGPYTILMFGQVKPYKGVDILVEALALIPEASREKMRVIVAGEAHMEMGPVTDRIGELNLTGQFDLRLRRQSDQEVSALFAEADCVVFPYREIDASGVYFLCKGRHPWLIASRVGIFAEDVIDGVTGDLVEPGDPIQLAEALERAAKGNKMQQSATVATSWSEIGRLTKDIYSEVA